MSAPQPQDNPSPLKNPRLLLAGGLAIAAVVMGGVVLAGVGGGSGDESAKPRVTRAALTLERASRPDAGGEELLVSLPVAHLNTPEINNGESVVTLRCVDSSGATAVERPVDWPLPEEEGLAPHIHEPAQEAVLDSIRGCTLKGAGIDFGAATSGPLPAPRMSGRQALNEAEARYRGPRPSEDQACVAGGRSN